jgi:peptidoglycan/xylan/chitin deacetylase (PgdA/CDA1 family)
MRRWAFLSLLAVLAAGCAPIRARAMSHGGGLPPNKLSAEAALKRIQADRDPYWLQAREDVTRGQAAIFAQDREERARGERLAKIVHGDPESSEIALTFDDGPHHAFTPRLLDVLQRENVKATFFVVGFQAEAEPDLVRRMVAEGHALGNHTYHHVSLPKIEPVYVADEIKACGHVLKGITGRAPHLFRPPGGQYTPDVERVAEALGYTTVLWTADPGDYASPGTSTIFDRTVNTTRGGGILLLHDGVEQTIDVLPTLIHTLRAEGYRFVTVDELMRHRRVPTPAPRRIVARAERPRIEGGAPSF